MKEIKTSGLPIFLDETTYDLEFREGLTCAGSGKKQAGQMKGLLYAKDGIDEVDYCYGAYRDIVFEKDRPLFQKYDFRYDITVIMPGTVAGECKKTSGHYHGYISGQTLTYPEVYEVLEGKAVYILQKVRNFDHENEEPVIEDLKAVFVEAGQAIIIPPFYGHCSINVGDGPMAFSNIAVISCPLHYEPVQKKHGLSVYVLKHGSEPKFVPNPNYANVPPVKVVHPTDNPALGITFGKPVYESFIQSPGKFDFLLNPASYANDMDRMLI
jgi:glucose-6-phosphate isomerase, archaeal